MLIEEATLRHWVDNFYGYGSWHARFWFVGHEEGGGNVPEEVADKINYFCKNHPGEHESLCDIRELYKHVRVTKDGPKASLYRNLYEYRFEGNAIQHGVWKNLIAFVHGYKDKKLPDLLSYQQKKFASQSPPLEALIPLYPLPSPHNHAWYYSWLDLPQLGFLKSRELYQEYLYQRRMQAILSSIGTYKPDVVLMYGMENINALKKSVQEFFQGVKFKIVKATTPTSIGSGMPQYHRADLNGTVMLITTQIPALRHNRAESGFDWKAFGLKVKESSE